MFKLIVWLCYARIDLWCNDASMKYVYGWSKLGSMILQMAYIIHKHMATFFINGLLIAFSFKKQHECITPKKYQLHFIFGYRHA